jgi:general secretion pathway protein I
MRTNAGFTLIEILIALTILSIALTAMIKATSQNIKDNMYLQNKMIATWVGIQVVNEVRVGVIRLPAAPSALEKNSLMLGRKWPWEASLNSTPNPHIQKIDVNVFLPPSKTPLIHLESYLYVV